MGLIMLGDDVSYKAVVVGEDGRRPLDVCDMLAVHEEGEKQAGLLQFSRNAVDVVILRHLISGPENSPFIRNVTELT